LAGRSRLSCTDRLDAAYAYVLESEGAEAGGV